MNNNNDQASRLKKEVLVRLIKAFDSGDFAENVRIIPYEMRPKGSEVTYRCCTYKERAILRDRVVASLGFAIDEVEESTSLRDLAKKALKREAPERNILTVLDTACKGCTPNRVFVTDLCQGCVARPCQSICKFDAIYMQNGKAFIDREKCKNCKMCIAACPYNAIVKITVPCEDACPVGAISKDEGGLAKIDFEMCLNCGKCIAACPFGAVHEKSQIVDILRDIKQGKEVIAMLAPSIAGQMPGTIGQLRSAALKLGFSDVYEVAQGADVTISNEAAEFAERMDQGQPFMTTSCCAGYRQLLNKHIPDLLEFVSDTQTPLYYTAEIVKRLHPQSVTVFVSPCAAKRVEGRDNPNVDYVINYKELGAWFVAEHIEILECEESVFPDFSSVDGKNFGITNGVATAVKNALKPEVKLEPCLIDGLNKDSIRKLRKFAKDKVCPEGNLVEVMCCEGGCVGGNGTLNDVKKATQQILKIAESLKKQG